MTLNPAHRPLWPPQCLWRRLDGWVEEKEEETATFYIEKLFKCRPFPPDTRMVPLSLIIQWLLYISDASSLRVTAYSLVSQINGKCHRLKRNGRSLTIGSESPEVFFIHRFRFLFLFHERLSMNRRQPICTSKRRAGIPLDAQKVDVLFGIICLFSLIAN